MISLEHARQIVSKYLLKANESVVDVRAIGDIVEVDTDNWTWIVEPAPIPATHQPVSSNWFIYDFSLDLFTDPAQHPEGFALFTDGKILRLSEKKELNDFWNLAGPSLEFHDLAKVLIRYQSDHPPAHIVQTETDLAGVAKAKTGQQVLKVTPPEKVLDKNGEFTALNFYTWYVANNPGGGADTITVDNWQVHVQESENLAWTVTTIAENLTWTTGI